MCAFRCALFLFASFLACSAADTQQAPPTSPPPPHRDPQALSLLAQCNGAMGGASILDTYASGTLTTDDPDVPSVSITTQTKGAAERFDTSSPKDQTFVLNGAQSWALRSGKQERVSYALSAFHRPEHVPALACLLDQPKANMSFVYLGAEIVIGHTAHRIKIFVPPSGKDSTDSMLSELNLFLDAQSLVVLKTERFVFDPHALENRSVWATYYSDYRRVGAALMPFHIKNYLDGHKVRDITFTSVQVNVGLSDLLFKK